jgi:flagellar biosynthesis protein FlhG
MKPLSEQDHYEILEIPRMATPQEIERAFRLAGETYSEDSLAGYSVFGEGEVNALRERAETAFRVLSDPGARVAYDASLSDAAGPEGQAAPRSEPIASSSAPAPIEPFEELDEESGEFDGARLRRCRLRRGMELEDIAGITKINPNYLQFIEEDRYADLPAAVYVRGFVSSYASCVGLDPRNVALSYMKRLDAEPAERGRSRFSR